MIGFHGDDDPVATPFDRAENSPNGSTLPPDGISRNTTDLCLSGSVTVTHSVNPPVKPSDFRAIGTYDLYQLLRQFGQKTEIYFDCTMDHGINDLDDNFGTSPTTIADITVYTVVRACVFFQSLIVKPNDIIPGPSRFINKANTRYNFTNDQGCQSSTPVTADPADDELAIDRNQCNDCKPFITDCN